MAKVNGAGGDKPLAPGQLLPAPDHLSASQINKLDHNKDRGCQMAWAYERRLGLTRAPGVAMLLGSAYDEGLNTWWQRQMGIACGPVPEASDEMAARDAAWVTWDLACQELNQTLPPAITAEAIKEGHIALERAVAEACKNYASLCIKVAEVQSKGTLHLPVSAGSKELIPVEYAIDRVDEDGTIVDHKWTGTKPQGMTAEWFDQLCVYAMAMAARERAEGITPVWPKRVRIEVCFMRLDMVTPQFYALDEKVGQSDLDRMKELIRASWKTSQGGVYAPNPGKACQTCAFVTRCKSDMHRLRVPLSALTWTDGPVLISTDNPAHRPARTLEEIAV